MATPYNPANGPRPGYGEDFILGNDPTALNILRQGRAAQLRAAELERQRKLKEAETIGKLYEEDRKVNYDAGGLFQPSFNAEVADAPTKLADFHRQYAAGQLPYQEFRAQVGDYKANIERNRLLSIDYDRQMKDFMSREETNPYRDRNGLRTALGSTVLVDDGKGGQRRIKASEYDVIKNQAAIDENPLTYEPEKIIEGFTKNRAASTMAEAQAGRIGGIHNSSTVTSNGFELVKGSDGAWGVKTASNGLPIINYSEEDLKRDRGSKPFDMAIKRLRLDYEAQRAEAEQAGQKLPEKSDLDLYKDKARKFYYFRESQSEGRNAQPSTGGAGSKPKYTTIGGDLGGFGVSGYVTGNNTSEGFASPYVSRPVKRKTSSGKIESYTGNVVHSNLTVQVPGQPKQHLSNNTDAAVIDYGSALIVLAKPNGSFITPPSSVAKDPQSLNAWMQKARSHDSSLRLTYAIDGVASKGLNGIQDPKELTARLMADAEANYKPISFATAEKQARQLLARRDAKYWTLYEGVDKDIVDANTDGAFARQQAQMEARLRQVDQATRPAAANTGGLYKKKAAPAAAPKPGAKTPTRPNTGGAY